MQDLAIANNIISEKDLAKLYAAEIDVPFTELKPQRNQKKRCSSCRTDCALQYNAVVFDIDANQTKLVAMSTDDVQALNFLQKATGRTTSGFTPPQTPRCKPF